MALYKQPPTGGGAGDTCCEPNTFTNFAQPAVGSSVAVTFLNPEIYRAGEAIFIAGGGEYVIDSVADPVVNIINTGSPLNAAPGQTVSINVATFLPTPLAVLQTLSTAPFTVPAVGATAPLDYDQAPWASVDSQVFVAGAGSFLVTGKTPTVLTLQNIGAAANVAPTTIVATGARVVPYELAAVSVQGSAPVLPPVTAPTNGQLLEYSSTLGRETWTSAPRLLTSLSFGALPSASGLIRAPKNQTIVSALDNADVTTIDLVSTAFASWNIARFGSTNAFEAQLISSAIVSLVISGISYLTALGARVQFGNNLDLWLTGVGGVVLNSDSAARSIKYTAASPEGVITAPVGSLVISGAGVPYYKATGAGNTGWIALSPAVQSTRGSMTRSGDTDALIADSAAHVLDDWDGTSSTTATGVTESKAAGTWEILTTGSYRVSGVCYLAGTGGGDLMPMEMWVAVDGVLEPGTDDFFYIDPSGTTGFQKFVFDTIVDLTAGELVSVRYLITPDLGTVTCPRAKFNIQRVS